MRRGCAAFERSSYTAFFASRTFAGIVTSGDCPPTRMSGGGAFLGSSTVKMHPLGIAVVAEGIETEAEAVKGLGCDLMQGYLFGHPAPGLERAP